MSQIFFFFSFLSSLSLLFYISQTTMADDIPEVPLSLVSNQYLDKKVSQIRQKHILWEVRLALFIILLL
jgi:hypothetical protein